MVCFQCIPDSSNQSFYTNELYQLKVSELRPHAQFTTMQPLYAALDKSRDVSLITDNLQRIQYMNRAGERVLMYRQDEVIGKSFEYLLTTECLPNLQVMVATLLKHREWEGSLTVKRKNAEMLKLYTKCQPVCCIGKTPTHFVITQDGGSYSTEWNSISPAVILPGK